ncbi:hypothetical protein [Antribacter gilvus]|uniref:hypothetical protein n=1 Tax=Antribacter gilvus TaxID=2304675 RepID=UPI000F772F52|nr:hypothetical protein [Antribacter gilvus]
MSTEHPQPPQTGRLSGSEMQMLMQMLSDVRSLVQGVDHKLNGMIPRPEFVQYQNAIDRRFTGLEAQVAEKRADHSVLEQKIQMVDDKVDTHEEKRNENYRSLNTKAWFALASAVMAGAVSLAVAIITNVIG